MRLIQLLGVTTTISARLGVVTLPQATASLDRIVVSARKRHFVTRSINVRAPLIFVALSNVDRDQEVPAVPALCRKSAMATVSAFRRKNV